MLVFTRKWVLRIASLLFWPLPVRRRVVLASNDTDRLRGNLRYLHAELVRRGDGFGVVTLLHRPSQGAAGKLAMLLAAVRAEYYLATSRVFVVDDYYFPLYVSHRKQGTTVIQTWHACGALKKVGYSVLDKGFGASRELVRQVDIHSGYDACLVASEAALPHYMEAFGLPAERFVSLGIPHTDFFFDTARVDRAVRGLRGTLSLPDDREVLLYAPTFRGRSKQAATSGLYLDLCEMRDRCAERYVLLLRRHPLAAERMPLDPSLEGFVYDVSDHDDVNELLAVADVLVTDYSSIIFEYALLGRPIALFAPDLATYERERGLYIDLAAEGPGPVFDTTGEVASYVMGTDFDLARVSEFRQRAFDVADGHASERVVEELVLPALGQD